jgi:hypothetical protein
MPVFGVTSKVGRRLLAELRTQMLIFSAVYRIWKTAILTDSSLPRAHGSSWRLRRLPRRSASRPLGHGSSAPSLDGDEIFFKQASRRRCAESPVESVSVESGRPRYGMRLVVSQLAAVSVSRPPSQASIPGPPFKWSRP